MKKALTYLVNNLLKDPISGSALKVKDAHTLVGLESEECVYEIKEGIPIVLKSDKSYVEHYQLDAQYFDYFSEVPEAWKIENKRLHQNIISLGQIKEAKTLVDIGSGGGWLVKHVLKKTKATIIPFDISYDNIRKLQMLYPSDRHVGVVGDALCLPFKDESLERVFAVEVMEHVVEPRLFIKKLLGAVTKDGHVIISTPYKEKIAQSLCIHCNKPTPHNAHLHSFDENNLKSMVPPKGFKVQFRKCNSSYLMKLQIHRLLWFLPFRFWKVLDQIFIALTGRAERIIMKITRE
ncbi:methyltransferase domain-containing protein [Carboxylicivirga taeanensis]|uniref:class I SAM-dependent methyltransferase n=1 Tax=Carboxylicivirga taeanensis TaxID=1416875 RepID=UPI003F6DFDF9